MPKLFPNDIVFLEAAPDVADAAALGESERVIVARAVPKRVSEFATARRLAREGLAQLGVPNAEVPHASDRSPIWPGGVTGSITHTDGYVAVVVAPAVAYDGLGIDAEPENPIEPGVWKRVGASEEVWVRRRAVEERAALQRLVFSAKESFYKAQHTVTRTFLGFDAVHVSLAEDAALGAEGALDLELTRDVPPLLRASERVTVRFERRGGLIVTACVFRRR